MYIILSIMSTLYLRVLAQLSIEGENGGVLKVF